MAITVTTEEQLNICDLTPDRVSLKTTTVTTVGDKTYADEPDWVIRWNNETGRASINEELETDHPSYYAAIMTMWGDEPTVFPEVTETEEKAAAETDTATE